MAVTFSQNTVYLYASQSRMTLKITSNFVRPTQIISSNSSIIDHILASFSHRVMQRGILNIGLSDPQLVYSTRNIRRIKRGSKNLWVKVVFLIMKKLIMWMMLFKLY